MLSRRALESLQHAIRALPRNAGMPEVSASARLLKKIGALDAAPDVPPDNELEEVRRRLSAALASGGIEDVATKDIRGSVWLLWADKEPLGGVPGLLEAVAEEAAVHGRTRRHLVEAWIAGFGQTKPRIADGGNRIRNLLDRVNDARMKPWYEVSHLYHFFAPSGPEALAREIAEGEAPVAALLQQFGLDDQLRAASGYAGAVQRALLTLATNLLRSGRAARSLDRIVEFVAPGGKLRFSDAAACAALARGLLGAWLDGNSTPSRDIQDRVRTLLLGWLKDPRQSSKWQAVDKDATALMLKWLARVSIEVFFEMIADHSNKDSFSYRRSFWEAYINANVVDEVWLALGSKIYHDARTHRALDGNYGKLEGAVQGNHAIFLMRIQGLIFCEWSHDGKVRAWKGNARSAPALNRASYDREDVVTPGLMFPRTGQGKGGSSDGGGLSHIAPQDGYWQRSVAELLARETGVRLTAKDWMPK